MTLPALRGALGAIPGIATVTDLALRGADDVHVAAIPGVRPAVVAAIAAEVPQDRRVLVVTATAREAEDIADAVEDQLGAGSAVVFTSWETLPHERLSPAADTAGTRVAALQRIVHPAEGDALRVVCAPVRSVLQPLVSGLADLAPITLIEGAEIDVDGLVAELVLRGYSRVDLVERRGHCAVRGGIIDIFPTTAEHPVRIELWGDTIEEIRDFAVSDQRSRTHVGRVDLHPARELLLTPAVRARARALAAAHPRAAEVLDRVAEGVVADGMEAFAPVLADGMELLVDVLPLGSLVLVCDPERIRARADDLVRTSQEFLEASWHGAAAGAATPLDVEGLDLSAAAYRSVEEVETAARARGSVWTIDSFAREGDDVVIDARPLPDRRGGLLEVLDDVRAWRASGDRVLVLVEGPGSAERIAASLRDEGIAATTNVDGDADASAVAVATARWQGGFSSPGGHLALITEADLFGERSPVRDAARMPSRRRRAIDPLQLAAGDLVVHEQHGVGRYVEMSQRTVGDATREYLVIEYAASRRGQPPDRLYVPTDQLDQVTRYVGGEAPALSKLGGSDWQRTKARARRAVREIADELVRLYAKRQSTPGHAFGQDTPWQHELEDAFPFVETPDQLASIDEVKADMERAIPMDRVICGDVGYGKTEIAVRAAFKAVQEGKQVAVLVPTTLLVQQHFRTFTERYAPFPVRVAALSRFQTDAEAKRTLEGLADGTVDVVIGTHRMLTPQVRFKDLGLLIVDEEQRFGVEHKEHIKALRTSVDVLTMSATPIPRTLEMSLTGIREMSTIQTPPEERHPVLTYVGPYDDRQVAAAIRRELIRDGQVFFIHNRVESIDRVAGRLRDLVPDARIAIAHGQMNEHELERIVLDFWERRIDVLVATTIVENGIDIPNANTLIVDRADALGLAQLHQLRGRVGRGRERGYAYLLYPPERPLTETAHERLATIAQHSDLGSGMRIALKDLEIRGAGNLLGGEQSGHIAEVGFDLYVRLVGEALAHARGDADSTPLEVKVELPLDAHIPHDYVPEERLRLEAYRAMAAAVTAADVDAVAEELIDRYGAPPPAVETLLAVARLRVRARTAGVGEIVLVGPRVRLHPVDLPESRQLRLTRLHPGTLVKPAVRTILVPRPPAGSTSDAELVEWVAGVLDILDPAEGPA
ncbi:MAG: transcription-repair coupling factor [Actinobacteria bacterium]|nr:transcription-repair coupling factor [Actinomycetota bacterium]